MRKAVNEDLPIIQYWHSPDVPADVAELIASVAGKNPDLHHLMFNEASAEEFIGERFGAREVEAFRACAVPAMQADYFRYCAALALGGFYADVDFRCVRPFGHLLEMRSGALLFRTSGGSVGNGFFMLKAPGHPLLRLVLDLVTMNIEERMAEKIWRVTGPWTLNALLKLHRLGSFSAARRTAAEDGLASSMEPLLERIGKYACVADAFADVEILTLDDPKARCVEDAHVAPLYKQEDLHWVNWQEQGRSIFR